MYMYKKTIAGAASLADSADFESKGCVRSILDV